MIENVEINEKDVFEEFAEVSLELIKNKDMQREINKYLAENHKIILGTFDEMLINQDKLLGIPQEELVAIINAVFIVSKNEKISPHHFFSEREIKRALKYKAELGTLNYPYTIEGVLRSSHNEFLTLISYQELVKMWNSGLLSYNYETQRAAKKKRTANGQIKKTPTIITKSVKNIAKLMLEGKFLKSTLTFNILADGTDDFEYDEGDLIVNEGTKVNLIDGAHRILGTVVALETKPDLEGSFEVSIRNYTLDQARYLIGLLNTVNRFDKTLVKFNTDDSYGGLIVKDLIRIPELRDRVETDKTTVSKALNMLTNYAILVDSVNLTFDPQSAKEQYQIADFLKKFYAILISSYPEDFKTDMKKRRSQSWFNHHNMHVGFIVIAKKIYDQFQGTLDFSATLVSEVVQKIDYTKGSGNELDKIMIEQGSRNSNQSKNLIRAYFEKEIKNILK
ncbi:DNA sulfur modification protein DndB [Paenibacillus sp. HB172176]|uniref:DNA sulfur modification protein DndB n=1 Tax=Paenibacillus sp. HB172176 TaxID=2493690 RepID=UPI00143C6571|nr:DNA sulfur modification protein DndB [Paenibacillus sp. HB172176]